MAFSAEAAGLRQVVCRAGLKKKSKLGPGVLCVFFLGSQDLLKMGPAEGGWSLGPHLSMSSTQGTEECPGPLASQR